ncbi:hypothetical protein GBF38_022178 [Nibea albiflora]|uniref:Uncharacterized protein n=1 Tax=Nibea albiflora TaxID=240163 RepID=A0ACB7FHE6_NIBAL|nr:hypothetical protein GBF38_022178 [Nibea albiflora]
MDIAKGKVEVPMSQIAFRETSTVELTEAGSQVTARHGLLPVENIASSAHQWAQHCSHKRRDGRSKQQVLNGQGSAKNHKPVNLEIIKSSFYCQYLTSPVYYCMLKKKTPFDLIGPENRGSCSTRSKAEICETTVETVVTSLPSPLALYLSHKS